MRASVVILLVCCVFYNAYSAKILGVVPTPAYSHQSAFYPLWKELSKRGHEVTVVTTNPIRDPKLINLTEIDISYSYSLFNEVNGKIEGLNAINVIQLLVDVSKRMASATIQHEEVQRLIHNGSTFDLIVIESLFSEFLALGEVFKSPTILITSIDAPSTIHMLMGNPSHPYTHPEYALPFYGDLNLVERIVSTIYQFYVNYGRIFKWNPDRLEEISKYLGNVTLPSVTDMVKNVDLQFINLNPILHDIRALNPTTIPFGGGFHIREPQELPKDIQKFLDEAKDGFIYFSLGTTVQLRGFAKDKLKSFIEVFGELPYKVLMKFDGDTDELPRPDNVKIVKWTRQQDVLRHPNIKVFITQGGLQSSEEAVVFHVPLVMIPLFADQFQNTKRLQHKGLGKVVNHNPEINKEELKNTIIEVATNPLYKNNAIKLGNLMLDEPMPGIEKVIWWTEYVLRHQGAKHLRNRIIDLPWYQYLLFDVIACILITTFVISAAGILIVRRVFKFFRPGKKSKTE